MKTRIFAVLSVFPVVLSIFFWPTTFSPSSQVNAQSDRESRIERGFEIAPVPLNMEGKDPALVGLGSYLVNPSGGCNDCHSAGPQTEYLPGGKPCEVKSRTQVGQVALGNAHGKREDIRHVEQSPVVQ